VNPALTEGREAEATTPAASSPTAPRRVVVVGAGPAGFAAACAAAERGAAVTVFGAGERPLRRLRAASALPGGAALSDLADHLEARAARAGVEYRGGRMADERDILALQPDEVVLACGAEPGLRERGREAVQASGAGSVRALTIVDRTGTATAPSLAVHASSLGYRVVLLTADVGPAALPLVERQRWAERCAAADVDVRTTPSSTDPATPTLVIDVARPAVGPAGLPAHLPLRRVGDCHAPGTLADALAAGEACGVPLPEPSR
jgi:NADPH-dependent 2,4-dienoyl-CoA reductase/sulfur reductase-like enzyme